jgi:hypothetical protein
MLALFARGFDSRHLHQFDISYFCCYYIYKFGKYILKNKHKENIMSVGIKFADKEQFDSLVKYGFCAFVLNKHQRTANHPEIGAQVDLCLESTNKGHRTRVRLVADQPTLDGGCISIYAAACSIFKQ